MKFLALFVAGAIATSVKRATGGIVEVTNALYEVGNNTDILTYAMNNFTDAGDLATILDATIHLREALDSGNSVVDATSPFSVEDAVTLIGPVGTLGDSTESSINATIAKIPAFEANALIAEVRLQLDVIQEKATMLSTNLIALIPESLASVADSLAKPITESLQRGVDAFHNASDASTSAAFMLSPNLQTSGMVAAAGLAFLVL